MLCSPVTKAHNLASVREKERERERKKDRGWVEAEGEVDGAMGDEGCLFC